MHAAEKNDEVVSSEDLISFLDPPAVSQSGKVNVPVVPQPGNFNRDPEIIIAEGERRKGYVNLLPYDDPSFFRADDVTVCSKKEEIAIPANTINSKTQTDRLRGMNVASTPLEKNI